MTIVYTKNQCFFGKAWIDLLGDPLANSPVEIFGEHLFVEIRYFEIEFIGGFKKLKLRGGGVIDLNLIAFFPVDAVFG